MPAANALNAFMASQGYRQDQEDRQRAIGLENTRGKVNALMMQPGQGGMGGSPNVEQARQIATGSGNADIMGEFRQQLGAMDEQTRARSAALFDTVGQVANSLRGVEVGQRGQALMSMAPQLQAAGAPPQEIQRYAQLLSDPNSSDAVIEALSSRVLEAQSVFDAYAPQMQAENELLSRFQGGQQTQGPINPNATANRALEGRGLNIQQQQADTARMNADTNRMEAEGQSGPDYGEINELYDSAEGALGDFRDIEDAYARVQASISQPSAAGDLALIFNFMKMLDPGSTVREGEFATAQNAAGVPDRARAAYNNIVNGQRMTPEQRSDFSGRAAQLYQAQRGLAEQRLSRFQEQADERQFPREQAIPRFADFGARPASAPQQQSSTEPSIDDLIRQYGG